jgi:CRP-like cAMP-binding protein
MTPKDVSALAQNCIAYKLRPEHFEKLCSFATPVYYQNGEQIIKHNATDSDLYVILEGHVNVLTDDGDKFYDAASGSVIGELAFLDAGPRAANAIAYGHAYVLKFPAQQLRQAMCLDKEFGFFILANLTRVVCARLRSADDALDKLMDVAHEAWARD